MNACDPPRIKTDRPLRVDCLKGASPGVAGSNARIRAFALDAAAVMTRVGTTDERTLCGGFNSDGVAVNRAMFRMVSGISGS